MKVYTYSEARQKFSAVLDIAKSEEVIIKRRGGSPFKVLLKRQQQNEWYSENKSRHF